jgi:hypothetical protein
MRIPSQSLPASPWAQQLPPPPAADAQRLLENALSAERSQSTRDVTGGTSLSRGNLNEDQPIGDLENGLAGPALSGPSDELRDVFREFVGKTLFGQMLASMRESVDKPAYFHGGQTEEIFQQQLDQVLVEEITEASADQIADPMLDLFQQSRR